MCMYATVVVLCVHVISVFPEKSFLDEVKSLSTVIVNDIVYMHVCTYSEVGTGGPLPPPPTIRTQYTSYQY